MEMESMEEGYLAKILIAEGTEGIPVGKVRMLSTLISADWLRNPDSAPPFLCVVVLTPLPTPFISPWP